VREDRAQTTPSLRSSSGADLKVKPMLDGRALQARALGKEISSCLSNCC